MGIWGVPRSGLTFQRQGNMLALIERLPGFDPAHQQGDFELCRKRFAVPASPSSIRQEGKMNKMAILLALVVGSCAGNNQEPWEWQKADMSNAKKDAYECLRDVLQTVHGPLYTGRLIAAPQVNPQADAMAGYCMTSKGYVWTRTS
jgi:hypothetical protein